MGGKIVLVPFPFTDLVEVLMLMVDEGELK